MTERRCNRRNPRLRWQSGLLRGARRVTFSPDLEKKMPFAGLLHLVLGVACAVHVIRTGRPYYWIFIILIFPVVGVLIYVIAEVLPDLIGARTTRRVASTARQILDPERAYREASRNLQISPTATTCAPWPKPVSTASPTTRRSCFIAGR